jgi:hypothetical protein
MTKQRPKKYWSADVMKHSDALDLERGVFTWSDPKRIARSLKKSAESSTRRKSSPKQSAMSMLSSTSIGPARALGAGRKESSSKLKKSYGSFIRRAETPELLGVRPFLFLTALRELGGREGG